MYRERLAALEKEEEELRRKEEAQRCALPNLLVLSSLVRPMLLSRCCFQAAGT